MNELFAHTDLRGADAATQLGRHNAYVQTIGGGAGGYFASCPTCGCDGFPDRATRAEAQADAEAHRDAYQSAGMNALGIGGHDA